MKLQKILLITCLCASIILFFVGVFNHWLTHILFGLVGTVSSLFLNWILWYEKTIPYWDETTNRFYMPHQKPEDNPHSARCPRCRREAILIHSVKPTKGKYRGVECSYGQENQNSEWSSKE